MKMGSHDISFWEQDALLKPYDLLVVGGGITGLMSALFYQRRYPSHRVAVLERGAIPRGASTRNAGFACIGSIGEHLADLRRAPEKHLANRLIRRYEGLQLLRETLGDEAIGYEPCGGYELFTSHIAFEEAARSMDRFNRWTSELLKERQVYEAGELNDYPVIYNRLEGALHPGKMMRSLIQKVQQAGVETHWNSPVDSIGNDGRVTLNGGINLEGQKILVAVNAFTRRLLPEMEVTPGRGYVFVTDEQPGLPWRGTFHHDEGYIYFRNVGDRLLIGGARNLAVEEEATDQFGCNDIIREHLKEVVTGVLGLKDWNIEQEWSGIMGFTPTKTPVVRQVSGQCFVAAGLSGMGIAIGSSIGREAAAMLSGTPETPGTE